MHSPTVSEPKRIRRSLVLSSLQTTEHVPTAPGIGVPLHWPTHSAAIGLHLAMLHEYTNNTSELGPVENELELLSRRAALKPFVDADSDEDPDCLHLPDDIPLAYLDTARLALPVPLMQLANQRLRADMGDADALLDEGGAPQFADNSEELVVAWALEGQLAALRQRLVALDARVDACTDHVLRMPEPAQTNMMHAQTMTRIAAFKQSRAALAKLVDMSARPTQEGAADKTPASPATPLFKLDQLYAARASGPVRPMVSLNPNIGRAAPPPPPSTPSPSPQMPLPPRGPLIMFPPVAGVPLMSAAGVAAALASASPASVLALSGDFLASAGAGTATPPPAVVVPDLAVAKKRPLKVKELKVLTAWVEAHPDQDPTADDLKQLHDELGLAASVVTEWVQSRRKRKLE